MAKQTLAPAAKTWKIIGDDGATIPVVSIGTGPGLVLLHGGGTSLDEYRGLAGKLSTGFTVHLYNRRGRPGAEPMHSTDTVDTDIQDLSAVLRKTDSSRVLAHSGGGFIAFQAARSLPISHLATYDGAIAVEGTDAPKGYLDDFQVALDEGDLATAFSIIGRAANPDEVPKHLPTWLHRALLAAFLKSTYGRRMTALVHTFRPEVGRILDHEVPATHYSDITAKVLLCTGAKSSTYFAQICEALAQALPNARYLTIPNARHNTANSAPKRLVQPLLEFFGEAG